MAITETARQAQRKGQHWELIGYGDASYGVRHGSTLNAAVRYVLTHRWPIYSVTDAAARRAYARGVRRHLHQYQEPRTATARRTRHVRGGKPSAVKRLAGR